MRQLHRKEEKVGEVDPGRGGGGCDKLQLIPASTEEIVTSVYNVINPFD